MTPLPSWARAQGGGSAMALDCGPGKGPQTRPHQPQDCAVAWAGPPPAPSHGQGPGGGGDGGSCAAHGRTRSQRMRTPPPRPPLEHGAGGHCLQSPGTTVRPFRFLSVGMSCNGREVYSSYLDTDIYDDVHSLHTTPNCDYLITTHEEIWECPRLNPFSEAGGKCQRSLEHGRQMPTIEQTPPRHWGGGSEFLLFFRKRRP